jgi:hypothetical protein
VVDCPGGEAEDAVAAGPQVVLSPHVRPGGARIEVLPAIDLDVHPPLREPDVEVAPPSLGIATDNLSGRLGKARATDEAQEVQFGE